MLHMYFGFNQDRTINPIIHLNSCKKILRLLTKSLLCIALKLFFLLLHNKKGCFSLSFRTIFFFIVFTHDIVFYTKKLENIMCTLCSVNLFLKQRLKVTEVCS